MGSQGVSPTPGGNSIGVPAAKRRWPLQVDFAVVALLVIIAGASAGAFVHLQSDADAKQTALADANFAAGKAAAQISSGMDIIKLKSTQPVANTPTPAQDFANPSGCRLGSAPIGAFDTGRIDIVRLDGSVVCSSRNPKPSGTIYAGASWLQTAAPAFVAPSADPLTGSKVAVISYPIGSLGVIAWFFDLTSVGPKLASEFGSGVHQLEFLVTSSDGSAIVARSANSGTWTGATLLGTPFASAADPVDRSDVEGKPRWYGQANVDAGGWKVYVGADKAAALADAAHLQNQQLEIVGIGVAAVLLALFVVYRRVARPIEKLSISVRSSRRLESPRLVPVGGPAQVADLGQDINHLISSLNREWAQRESAERNYLSLFEGSPLPIMVVDPTTGKFLEVNDSAATAFAYSREELIELTTADLFSPKNEQEAAQVEAARNRAVGKSYAGFGPVSVHKKDGTLMRVIVSSYEVTFAGRPARVSMVEDVTEKEKLERQINQSQRLESLGQLAGGVAHDFNNLIGVFMNFALFAKEKVLASGNGKSDPDLQLAVRDIDRAVRAGESAARLTHQLLAFARREVIRPQSLDVNTVVGELEPLLRRTLGEHIEFVTSLDRALWPALMDPGQLEQVLTNLAINARDAMPKGGRLAVDCENVDVDTTYAAGRPGLEPGRYVRIRVTDTGSGMDAATLQRVFEPFFTTKPKGQGTGLGLATVYGIVKQAGGDVSIYSEVGVGTRVHVLLPASDLAPIRSGPAVASPSRKVSGTILVVEDADDLREVTDRILAKNGYHVISAANGPDALEAAKHFRGPIDLLLTDVVMPRMQGNELAVRLVAVRPDVRVLYMSGYARPILGDNGTLEDGVMLVEKPFTEPVLLAKVDHALHAAPLSGTPEPVGGA
jgi:PAS domain S-box-containing protein